MDTKPCYATLKAKTRALDRIPGVLQQDIARQLQNEKYVEWGALRSEEEARLGKKLPKQWRHHLVHALSTPGRFQQCGDQARARGAKQQAIVEYVEHKAKAAGPELSSDTVADVCIHDVAQRWRSPTPEGTTIIHRVVQLLVKRVRDKTTDGNAQLIEQFECITIEEVKTVRTEANEGPQLAGIPLKGMDPSVICELLKLKMELESRERICTIEADATARKADADARKAEADANARKADADARAWKAEAEARSAEAAMKQRRFETGVGRLNGKCRLIELQQQSQSHKRSSDVCIDDRWLEAKINTPWSNMQPLSGAIWEGRPSNCTMGLHDVLERCKVWMYEPENMRSIQYRCRVFPQFPKVSAGYCDTKVNVTTLVHSFWNQVTTDNIGTEGV